MATMIWKVTHSPNCKGFARRHVEEFDNEAAAAEVFDTCLTLTVGCTMDSFPHEAVTRRERIATACLQSMLSGDWDVLPPSQAAAEWAVRYADALIAELDK
jgi:hypothetical protein